MRTRRGSRSSEHARTKEIQEGRCDGRFGLSSASGCKSVYVHVPCLCLIRPWKQKKLVETEGDSERRLYGVRALRREGGRWRITRKIRRKILMRAKLKRQKRTKIKIFRKRERLGGRQRYHGGGRVAASRTRKGNRRNGKGEKIGSECA